MTPIVSPRGRLLTTAQAMEYLGMPEQRLRRLVLAKKIPVHRDGRLGFWTADLEAWIERHRTPAVDEPKSRHIVLPTPPPSSVKCGETGIDDLLPSRRRLSQCG